MGVAVKMTGLTELRKALRELSEDLAQESMGIVEARAQRAAQDTRTVYAQGPTGNLIRGVRVSRRQGGRFAARVEVRSTAPHSHLWEQQHPPVPRQTSRGFNRGTMRPTPEHRKMVPIAIRQRREMTRELIEVVRRAGFQVNDPTL